eukprot:TRINITY_DN12364_c0_g1_i1.p1 TRINITY_DN12364_c0_g1~~TRINITY_DN12364_c0_g1_i1.p1  ORF type:complete len:178 (-),score=59.30 TRINITY_DN12364_c0_g1_i1:72-605(-)
MCIRDSINAEYGVRFQTMSDEPPAKRRREDGAEAEKDPPGAEAEAVEAAPPEASAPEAEEAAPAEEPAAVEDPTPAEEEGASAEGEAAEEGAEVDFTEADLLAHLLMFKEPPNGHATPKERRAVLDKALGGLEPTLFMLEYNQDRHTRWLAAQCLANMGTFLMHLSLIHISEPTRPY